MQQIAVEVVIQVQCSTDVMRRKPRNVSLSTALWAWERKSTFQSWCRIPAVQEQAANWWECKWCSDWCISSTAAAPFAQLYICVIRKQEISAFRSGKESPWKIFIISKYSYSSFLLFVIKTIKWWFGAELVGSVSWKDPRWLQRWKRTFELNKMISHWFKTTLTWEGFLDCFK